MTELEKQQLGKTLWAIADRLRGAMSAERQNRLLPEHIEKIVSTYQFRRKEPRYSRCVPMAEIVDNDFNLNISRYISTAVAEKEIDLTAVNTDLVALEQKIEEATREHNAFLKELGLPLLP